MDGGPFCELRVAKRMATPVSAEMIEGARPAEMSGFIKPQLATLRSQAPSGPHWLHEIKYDGYRVQIHLNRGKKKVFTRNGLDRTKRFPDVSNRRPAELWWWWHAPPHHGQFAVGTSVAHDGCRVVWKHARHGRQVANVAVHDPKQGGDGGLICSDGI
jgi:hypothetical protein